MILPARLPAPGQSPCPRPPANRRRVPLRCAGLPAGLPAPGQVPCPRRPASPRRVSLPAPGPRAPPRPPPLRAPRSAGGGPPRKLGRSATKPRRGCLPRLLFVARQGVPCLGFPLLSASRWRAAPPPLRVARAPSLAVKALRAPLRSALRPAPRWRAPRACGLDSQAARASGTVGGAAKMGALGLVCVRH